MTDPRAAPLRLAVVVTEFPKVTETFILRDLVKFGQAGHEVRIYHVTPFRQHEVVHGFASHTVSWARSFPYFDLHRVLPAMLKALARRPLTFVGTVGRILWAFRREPVLLAKSLLIMPKSLAIAEELRRWPADHVHAEFAGHPATCAWIIGRFGDLPYSVSCRAHDIFVTQSLLAEKLAGAAFIRTISEFNVRFLRERLANLGDRPFHVIHSSVPVPDIPALAAPEPGPFRVLYIGSLHVRKGVDVLLRALAAADSRLGDWVCEIGGGGPESAPLKRLCAELDLDGRVAFRGPLSFEEVSAAYAWANVVAVPSLIGPDGWSEGIPNVVIEALAHQRPCITTGVSGIPELVEDMVTGRLIPPAEVAPLAEALVWVKEHPDQAYALAVAGRARVAREFDLDTNTRAQMELFARHGAGRGNGG